MNFGPYVLDFYCHDRKLAVELDGSQHSEQRNAMHDEERTRFLEARGLRVVRFNNREVLLERQAVAARIWQELGDGGPSP